MEIYGTPANGNVINIYLQHVKMAFLLVFGLRLKFHSNKKKSAIKKICNDIKSALLHEYIMMKIFGEFTVTLEGIFLPSKYFFFPCRPVPR